MLINLYTLRAHLAQACSVMLQEEAIALATEVAPPVLLHHLRCLAVPPEPAAYEVAPGACRDPQPRTALALCCIRRLPAPVGMW
jgi:hypothetical protein